MREERDCQPSLGQGRPVFEVIWSMQHPCQYIEIRCVSVQDSRGIVRFDEPA